jgi:uncharacterized cupredoxin-like copper-binding protein
MKMVRIFFLAGLISTAPPVFAGGSHGGERAQGMATGKVVDPSKADRSVSIQMHDSYYSLESIEVEQGEVVRFEIENEGDLVHEFNIGTASMHEAHQKEMAMMARKGAIQGDSVSYNAMGGSGNKKRHDDPNSILLEPGEEKVLVWKFLKKADLEFACNVPGHYQAGMRGDIHFK